MGDSIVDQINESMEKLTAQITNKKRVNDTFKEQVASKINAINTLIRDIKDKMSNFSKTQDDIDTLGKQMQILTNENTSLKAEIARLEQLSKEHGVTHAQLEEALQQKSALEKQVEENTSTLATTQNERQALQTTLENILQQLNDKITALESLTPDTDIINQLETIREELEKLSGTPPTDDIPPSNPPAAGDDTSPTSSVRKGPRVESGVLQGPNIGYARTRDVTNPPRVGSQSTSATPTQTTGGKTRRHRKRRVSKRKTLKRKKLKGGYTADFEKKNKELRDKMRKRSKRHHSLRRPSSSTRKLSTSSKSSRRYKRSH